jgi:CarD family transcriptional regulator
MYLLNEKVVYPGHGVAKINRIIEKIISGNSTIFYELKFLNKEMTILVPTDNIVPTGIRKLSSEECINHIFAVLAEPDINLHKEACNTNWNKRSKLYQFKLRTGDLLEISKIYKDLQFISQHKELSFGERTLLLQIENLLAQEISLVKDVIEQQAVDQLRSFFAVSHKPSHTQPKAYL